MAAVLKSLGINFGSSTDSGLVVTTQSTIEVQDLSSESVVVTDEIIPKIEDSIQTDAEDTTVSEDIKEVIFNDDDSVPIESVVIGVSTFVMAYAVHKVFAPLRIATTLTATPFIIRHLRKIGFLKPPKPKSSI